MISTKLCLENKVGGCCTVNTPYLGRSSRLDTFLNVNSWMLLWDFLQATWRSILSSRDVLKSGYRWKIGDGRKVQIWMNHWVPIVPVLGGPRANGILNCEAFMSGLIDYDLKVWKDDLIHDRCLERCNPRL